MRSGVLSRLAALFVSAVLATPAAAQGFFGPTQPASIDPEADAYLSLGETVRLQAQVNPTFTPAESAAQWVFGAYVHVLVANILERRLHPDRAKTHLVDLRAGVLYTATTRPSASLTGDIWTLQLELTPRYDLPLGLLASIRNRVAFGWQAAPETGYGFRYRGLVQLEREISIGSIPVTPYVNTELFWQSQPSMWTQFRMEGGVSVAFDAFAKGQSIDVNYTAVTLLQPSRTWFPLWGIILSSYF